MAKLLVEFDTVQKAMSVTLDGKPMENVNCVRFYTGKDYEGEIKSQCCIEMMTKDKDNGIVKYENMMASQTAMGTKSDIEGFVTTNSREVAKDTLAKLYEGNKK